MSRLKIFNWLLIFLGVIFDFWFLVSGFYTFQALKSVKALELSAASRQTQIAKWLPLTLSTCTLHLIPDLEIWSTSLQVISQTNDLQLTANNYLGQLADPQSSNHEAMEPLNLSAAESLSSSLDSLNSSLTHLLNSLNSPFSLVSKLPKSHSVISALQSLQVASKLIREIVNQDLSLLILFQNTDELRATGGFMGSFAIAKLESGQISELNFYDIYDADGQFTGYLSAPAGIDQYLSEGKGLRLPDANWEPDFPTSAQTVTKILSESGFGEFDGVIALNSTLVEKLLKITGSVYVPDYGITVTSDNFATVARADRSVFFPGSKAKKSFLASLFVQLKLKLNNLTAAQRNDLLLTSLQSFSSKEIQIYFADQDLQQLASQLNLTGELTLSPQSSVLNPKLTDDQPRNLVYLVESNVGINKANALVEREVFLNLDQQTINVVVNFTNNNLVIQPFSHSTPQQLNNPETQRLDYINYQRLIVNDKWQMINVELNGEPIEQIDEQTITNSHGDKFKQFGFLVPVPASEQASLTFQLTSPYPLDPSLYLVKQPGLPPTSYTINTGKQTETILLEKDQIIIYQHG